jgi:hypothetical protein
MPCYLVVYRPSDRSRNEYVCDEENTARLVEEDHGGKASGTYTDIEGRAFEVDWTQQRLVGFTRKREDGEVVASGGADGTQTPVC